ncbi:MAG: 4-alpha-glucanotransferase, partial [Chromatiales bacterium]|nr:4-alpha-glucanotransferase [Chromatiales bacterium]
MAKFDFIQRRLGVLLHPTSLPSGTLEDAFRWIDFMSESGLSVWQVLPFGIPQGGISPYQCLSAFAINPALVGHIPTSFDELSEEDFQEFCEQQRYWIDDFALYMIIRSKFDQQPWFEWPALYKQRDSKTLDEVKHHYSKELKSIKLEQCYIASKWQKIHDYCQQRDIHVFGDLPIFVAHDSADVWTHQELFLLDRKGLPSVVAGVPPDYFSETGQRWGNPHYNWEAMQSEQFEWWMQRFHHNFEWFDLLRIDHFRGFDSVWMIDASCETAIDGYWQKFPGDSLLNTLKNEMALRGTTLPLVAEDLGVITDEVRALKKKYHLPGMSVLQFSFDEHDDNPHKPKNVKSETVIYTGTHDNDTSLGWFRSLSEDVQQHVLRSMEVENSDQIVEKMIKMV